MLLKLKHFTVTLAALLACVVLSAQHPGRTVTVSGTVVDEVGPVGGATVTVKGHPEMGGKVTGPNGEFSFSIQPGMTLQISCIGYKTAEKAFDKADVWYVVMEDDAIMLDEVIAVGYGTQRKESVVGSISQVGSEALVNSGTTNITNALAGKLAGVMTYQSSGQPGNNDATIFIRGLSSWNGSGPLVMVDGIERSFSELDPNEVQTISVLKDASATAVFGAKGANGVILVTTKTGSKGAPKMKLSVDYGLSNPETLPEYIDAGRIAEMANIARKNEQSFSALFSDAEIAAWKNGTNPLRYPSNDWFRSLLKDFANDLNANFNIRGGSDKVKYFVSVGYTHEGAVVKQVNNWSGTTFNYNRINYRSNLDFQLTKSTLLTFKIGGNTGVVQNPNNTSVAGLFTQMYNASPMMFPAYFPESALARIPDTDYPDASGARLSDNNGAYTANPYTTLASGDFVQTTTSKLNTDVILKQGLDFITKGLYLRGLISLTSAFSKYSQQGTQSYPTYRIDWDAYEIGANPWVSSKASSYVYVEPPTAITQDGTARNTSIVFYWETSLNYERKFKKKHNVTAMALFNQREYDAGASFPHRNQGLVGRVTYDYKGKYLFEGNIGVTGSEQFAPSYRYGVFPSAAAGYYLSKEKFWKRALPWWSTMKLRYSDGYVGSDSASDNWLYYSSYIKSDGNIIEMKSANVTARWETAHKRDLGIEMGWLKDALTFNIDFYDEYRYDMLVTPQSTTPFVGIAYKDVNNGRMKKHGIDFEIKWKKSLAGGLYYEIGGMLGVNENRILNYDDPPYTPDYQKTAGKAYKSQTNGMTSIDSGYYNTIDEIHGYPATLTNWTNLYTGTYKLLDYNGDGYINSSDLHAIYGSAYAPVTYSMNFGLSYKGFSFNMLWYGNAGKYIDFNRGYEKEFIKADLTMHKAQLDYWTPTNRNAGHNNLAFNDAYYSSFGGTGTNGFNMALLGHTWRKSDYLTLKELYLSYTFDGKTVNKILGLKGLSVTATANNLFTLTDLIEGDPQRTSLAASYYPLMRTFKLGVKLDF